MLKEYDRIPEFLLKNNQGKEVKSSNYLGRYTVLYFYPKAFTPGCTKECNAFSDNIDEFISFKMDNISGDFRGFADNGLDFSRIDLPGVDVVGISPDSPENLAKFKSKYDLKVDLLSDPAKEVAAGFSALKEDGSSILRSTFIVDPWNRIRKSWYGVNVKGHVEEVLVTLKEIVAEDIKINPQIMERRAKRSFDENKMIPELMIKQLIGAAHLAPSCFNNQPWRFSVVKEKSVLEKLDEYIPTGNYWLKKAAVLIAVYAKAKDDCQLSDGRDYYLFDTGIAVGNLLTQATQMGLIAHPVAGYDPEGFKKVLNITGDNTLITVIGVGFPADVDYLSEKHQGLETSPRDRVDIEDVLVWNGNENLKI